MCYITRLVIIFVNFFILSSLLNAEDNIVYNDNYAKVSLIEKYLNNIKFLSSNFIQESDGAVSEGKIYLLRPGKMRIEYNNGIIIVINGSNVVYRDVELDETSYITSKNIPIHFLVKDDLSLKKDVKLVEFFDLENYYQVVIKINNAKEAEISDKISLFFKKNPIGLVAIDIEDSLEQSRRMSFYDADYKSRINKDLFVIRSNKLPE